MQKEVNCLSKAAQGQWWRQEYFCFWSPAPILCISQSFKVKNDQTILKISKDHLAH